jgi:hypothetical protein
MHIRNNEGKLVYFDATIYKDEKALYCAMWKILYNVEFAKITVNISDTLINFIK